ncbi:hypothetical protein [Leifsonia sp. NPDC058248]|uniref:hypothetical protein n=1 Tax=Leifsonia sp. NPDC058248 TaxID=3346402 RepID=UPI0036DCAD71
MALTVVLRLNDGDADIVESSVQHYRREGVDHIVLVDESHDDEVRLAAEAVPDAPELDATVEFARTWSPSGGGWHLDAHGGEFWIASDPGTRLADAFARLTRDAARVDAPVTRMTGAPAATGSGLARLTFRDLRPPAEAESVGLTVAPSTRTALRPGADVPVPGTGVEVLRFDQRSIRQVRARAGGGAEAELAVARYLALAPGEPAAAGSADGVFEYEGRLADLGSPETALSGEERAVEVRAALLSTLRLVETLRPLPDKVAELEAAVRGYTGSLVGRTADGVSRVVNGAGRRAGRAVGRGRAVTAHWLRARGEERRAATVRRLLDRPIPPTVVLGTPRTDAVPLVMCLWNRPQRLGEIVRMLAAQESGHPVRLVLWNNAPQHQAELERVLADLPLGALSSVELYASPANIGGVARFVVARWLRNAGTRGAFIMLDDDQQVGPDFVDRMLADYAPHTIAAWWAFANHGSHWRRSELEPGEDAGYAGTGGAVADLDLVSDATFFDLPARYLMLEDQWMTYYARTNGWTVRKSAVSIEQVMAEESENQYHGLRSLKDEFYDYLYGDRRGAGG